MTTKTITSATSFVDEDLEVTPHSVTRIIHASKFFGEGVSYDGAATQVTGVSKVVGIVLPGFFGETLTGASLTYEFSSGVTGGASINLAIMNHSTGAVTSDTDTDSLIEEAGIATASVAPLTIDDDLLAGHSHILMLSTDGDNAMIWDLHFVTATYTTPYVSYAGVYG